MEMSALTRPQMVLVVGFLIGFCLAMALPARWDPILMLKEWWNGQ